MASPAMRAAVMERFGEPDVLSRAEVPAPSPGRDEVVLAVEAVPIDRSFDLPVRRDGNNRGEDLRERVRAILAPG